MSKRILRLVTTTQRVMFIDPTSIAAVAENSTNYSVDVTLHNGKGFTVTANAHALRDAVWPDAELVE